MFQRLLCSPYALFFQQCYVLRGGSRNLARGQLKLISAYRDHPSFAAAGANAFALEKNYNIISTGQQQVKL